MQGATRGTISVKLRRQRRLLVWSKPWPRKRTSGAIRIARAYRHERRAAGGRRRSTRTRMTTFDKREDAFEKQFVHDEELRFKAIARRDKLLGLWAAEKLGLSGA